jgi:hypothetical protein
MKKSWIIIFTFLISASLSFAGEKRFNLYGGYVLDDKFDSYYDPYNYFNGKIKGGFQYGAGVEFFLPPFNGAEITYIGQHTTAPTYYYPSGTNTPSEERKKILDLNFNYVLGGFTRYFLKEGKKLEPYGSLMLGALFANANDPESGEDRNSVKFSWALRAGTNLMVSDKLGFKFQAMLLSTVQTAGGTLYFGSGGYSPGTTTASSMLQLSFSGGLVYKLSKNIINEE